MPELHVTPLHTVQGIAARASTCVCVCMCVYTCVCMSVICRGIGKLWAEHRLGLLRETDCIPVQLVSALLWLAHCRIAEDLK